MTWSKMYSQSLYIITDVLFNFRPHSYSNAEYILEDFRWFEWKFIFNICFYCVMLSWRVLVYQWLFLFPYYPAPVKTEMIVFYKCAHGVSYCIYLVKPSRWLAPVATASCLHHTKVNSLAHGRSYCDFENVILNLALLIGIFKSPYDNFLIWMPENPYWW